MAAFRELFCYHCSLQFATKSIYDIHVSIMHSSEKIVVESELPEFSREENTKKINEFDVTFFPTQFEMNSTSFEYGRELGYEKNISSMFKCEFCDSRFLTIHNLKFHIASSHDGKNLFKCWS